MTTGTPERRRDPDQILAGFARALRAAGVRVSPDRVQQFLRAVAVLGLADPAATRAAGRATLCAGPDDLARFDPVFDAWFGFTDVPEAAARTATPAVTLVEADGSAGPDDAPGTMLAASASRDEVLRRRDIATLDPAERRRLAELFATLRPRPALRRTARRRRWRRGEVDAPRTLRDSLRRLGEPARISRRRAEVRPRRVVLLIDVSGSMSSYADALLRLAHRYVLTLGASVEVFTLGTRLTRLTPVLRVEDAERALVAVGQAVPDWSGGTRLGETLGAFLDRWGARGMARGAVVVVCSDGWERGDLSDLRAQMARLHRLAHRVVWLNPHRGKPGYQPVQRGVVAVLDHVDDFVAGHSLASYDELCRVVAAR